MDATTPLWQLRQNVRAQLQEEAPAVSAWGAIPLASALAAAGLLLIAVGDTVARFEGPFPDVLFWAGILLVVVPVALRLLVPTAERGERVALVALLAIATYVVKILHSPSYFSQFDELLHTRTADDINQIGHLFSANPLLPVSPLFPGLELATTALSQLTGVPTFDAGVAIVGLARILLVLALFALFEEVSGSSRVAGIATFLYATNPSFVFFDAQFAYESLALPMAVVAILGAIRWQRDPSSVSFAVLTFAAIAGTVVTHHLTSYVLVAFLVLWAVVSAVLGGRGAWRLPAAVATGAALIVVAWTIAVASATIAYMEPRVADALDLIKLLLGQSPTRALFQSSAGTAAPDWERFTAIATVVITLLLITGGLWIVWRDRRRDIAVVALAIGALAYPASLALRLTQGGAEESTRIPEFAFLGVALLGGLVAEKLLAARLRAPSGDMLRGGLLAATAALVFAGGLVVGVPRWARLPGPFLPAADPRSISAEGRTAAAWAADFIGSNRRIVTDRINRILLGSVAREDTITSYGNGIDTWRLFYTTKVDTKDLQIIRQGQIQILVTDQRLTTALPLTQVYFENGEPDMFNRTKPLDPQFLDKWSTVDGVSRFFDSGNIRMYDVRSLDGT